MKFRRNKYCQIYQSLFCCGREKARAAAETPVIFVIKKVSAPPQTLQRDFQSSTATLSRNRRRR